MSLISDLQKTIVILTQKLENYEKRTGKRIPKFGSTWKSKAFSVEIGNLGSSLDLNQVQSYRSALITANQPSSLTGLSNLKKSCQPFVPQPGSGVGTGTRSGVGSGVGSGPGSMSGVNGGRMSGRYDPFRDRNNKRRNPFVNKSERDEGTLCLII